MHRAITLLAAGVRHMADRIAVTVRMTKALVDKIDARMRRRQRRIGTTKWSRNDEILALLDAAMRRGRQ